MSNNNVECRICGEKYHLCSSCDIEDEHPYLYEKFCSVECEEKHLINLEYKKYIAELMGLDIKETDEAIRLFDSVQGFDNKEEFGKFKKSREDGTLKGYLEIGKKLMEASGVCGIESIREIVKCVNRMDV